LAGGVNRIREQACNHAGQYLCHFLVLAPLDSQRRHEPQQSWARRIHQDTSLARPLDNLRRDL